MQEIYVGQDRRSNVGCLLLVLLAAGIGAAIYFWHGHRSAARAAAPAPAETPAAAAAPAAAPGDTSLQKMADARVLQKEGQLLEARMMALEVIDTSNNPAAKDQAEVLLNDVDIALVFAPYEMPEKVDLIVQSGDSLASLAKKYNTTVETIRRGNRLSGYTIRAGDTLRVVNGTWAITCSKSLNTLVLTFNGKFFKRYRVGTGQYGKTPVGQFVIADKIPNPPWWRPDGKLIPYGDTNNVLGTHWMALSSSDGTGPKGYGIHGTWQPETVGTQSSAGCIRLVNQEIEELFTLVPQGTPVTITD